MGLIKGMALVLGLAVMLAGVFGAASMVLAADGKPFLLGEQNVSQAVSTLVKRGAGPALSLKVGAEQPPLAVNSPAKVTNLNVDSLDGKDSTDFLASGAKASDADRLDGKDSSDFAPRAVEAWRVVDADYGGSGFYVSSMGQCATASPPRPNWMDIARFGNDWARAAYFKDAAGVVHLKGQVRDNSSCYPEYSSPNENAIIFVLPQGYRPTERQSFGTTSNHAFGEALVRPDGAVIARSGSLNDFSLNGISFRAAN